MELMKDGKITGLTSEELVDFLSCVNTAIAYWAQTIEIDDKAYAESITKDSTLEECWEAALRGDHELVVSYYDQDGDEDTCTAELNMNNIINGFNSALDNGWNGSMDTLDDEVADMIVQYALFEDIIYG